MTVEVGKKKKEKVVEHPEIPLDFIEPEEEPEELKQEEEHQEEQMDYENHQQDLEQFNLQGEHGKKYYDQVVTQEQYAYEDALRAKQTGQYMPQSEIELESQFINPDANSLFEELTRDLRTSNLSETDVEIVCGIGEIISSIVIIENKYFKEGDLDRLKLKYIRELQYIANSRAAFGGFIARLAKTQRMENVTPMELSQPYEGDKGGGFMDAYDKWAKGQNKGGKGSVDLV